MSDGEDALSHGGSERKGMLLSSRYELQEQIGTGGMGEVWRASDTLLNRPVAVKLLHSHHMSDTTSRERFRTEARITAVLSHPGIAQVYDYGEQDDHAFLVMELIPGDPLSAILKRHPRGLDPAIALDIVDQAARALGAAHARGVVHRDFKPGNLLVTEDGTVRLTDFGIARGNESLGLTQTGMVMGTAQYISPEQASGKSATHASDLYALGVVAHECLTGAPPFHADSPVALALAHVRQEPPPLPSHLPAPLRDLVAQLLRKEPAQRPASTAEVAARVQGMRVRFAEFTGAATGSLASVSAEATAQMGAQPPSTTATQPSPEVSGPGTQPNPPIDPSPLADADDSVKLAEKSEAGLLTRPRMILLVLAAIAIVALGTVLLSQMLSGGGGDEADADSDPTPSPVRETSDTNLPEDDAEQEAPVDTPESDPGDSSWENGESDSQDDSTQDVPDESTQSPEETTDPDLDDDGELDTEPDPPEGGEDGDPETPGLED